jgi:hypothetical protein
MSSYCLEMSFFFQIFLALLLCSVILVLVLYGYMHNCLLEARPSFGSNRSTLIKLE